MAFVPDSRTYGYLGPADSPAPLEGDAWIDFLHDVVTGVTGLPGSLVRPRWQKEPPNVPDINVDWAAVGVTETSADWQGAQIHVPDGDGYDLFQRMETSQVLCTFYGPNTSAYASMLRDGLNIDQNVAELRKVNAVVVEIGPFTRAPELFRNQWRDRIDVNVVVRREILRKYPVLNLLRAHGTIQAEPPGDERIITTDWITEEE